MPTITVRALGPKNDPLQGNGQNNFISDLEAVTQIIKTRLLLFQGEWFLNLLDGLPLFQSILESSGGAANLKIVMGLIAQRIRQTQYVNSISKITVSYLGRRFSFSAVVETQFGTVYVTNTPGASAALS